MRTKQFADYLKTLNPSVKFYTGAIDKTTKQCIGVYGKGQAIPPNIALGGLANTSYATKPITLLIHWTENSDTCEQMAQTLYDQLLATSNFTCGGIRVISIQMPESCPQDVGRDDNNVCEYVIRLNIIYER